MDKLNEIISKAEAELGDVSLYEAENKKRLTEVLATQASAKSEIEDVEMEWMDLQEQIEEKENASQL